MSFVRKFTQFSAGAALLVGAHFTAEAAGDMRELHPYHVEMGAHNDAAQRYLGVAAVYSQLADQESDVEQKADLVDSKMDALDQVTDHLALARDASEESEPIEDDMLANLQLAIIMGTTALGVGLASRNTPK